VNRAVARVAVVLALVAIFVAAAPVSPEARTAQYFRSIRTNPALLYTFLREMPKGGDLHNHLSGSIYAESYLAWAAADGLCLKAGTIAIVAPPCDAQSGAPPATAVFADMALYSRAIDTLSMRNWDPALNGHDHFFATFAKFGPAQGKTGDMIAEVAARAATEHVSYLELMVTTTGDIVTQFAPQETLDRGRPDFAGLRDRLMAAGFREAVKTKARSFLDESEARKRTLLGCGTPRADPGCAVTVRYIAQVTRTNTPAQVFTQILGGFEAAVDDSRIVSLNLVAPEDYPVAVNDFDLHMSMLAFLQPLYPAVKVTLHAGELTDGLVPPDVLRSHIRKSIEQGHARRIGHGVDVLHEDGALALLKSMAAKNVLVEVALTSNDVILGVRGAQHPLATYLKYGVPVALVTDDPGVARSSLTLEYRKAVLEQGLNYLTLKRLARNSIDFAFVEDGTKAELRAKLDADLQAFERVRRD
jgi:adenosine deaminase